MARTTRTTPSTPAWIRDEAYIDTQGRWRFEGFTASEWAAVAAVRTAEGRADDSAEASSVAQALKAFDAHARGESL